MENRDVRTFIKVVELNNFTKAAAELGYSQTAVSAQIRKLEEELGHPLFDRVGKSIHLTSAGKTFLPYARKMIRAEEEAIACLSNEDLEGVLVVGGSSSIAARLIPQIAKPFISKYPKVQLSVKVIDSYNGLTHRMKLGEIDLALDIFRGESFGEDAISLASDSLKMVFIASPDNPISRKHNVSIDEFIKEPIIISDKEGDYTEFLIRTLRNEGYEIKPILEISSVTAIVDFVKENAGVAYVPYYMAAGDIENGTLAMVDLDFPDSGLTVNLICNKDRWMNPQMRAFKAIMEERLDDGE